MLLDIATQLAALEAVGLHHNDVRTWNVLIAPISREVEHLLPFRAPKLNPDGLPKPYRSRLLASVRPAGERMALRRSARKPCAEGRRAGRAPSSGRSGLTAALQAMEDACGLYRAATIEWRNRATLAEGAVQQLQRPATIAG